MYLHDYSNFRALIEAIAFERRILPEIVEKDYWVMHALYGLQKVGLTFYLKGGTSLSKGYSLIERFSEDLDLMIEPPAGMEVAQGANQESPKHIATRKAFFSWVEQKIEIPGFQTSKVSIDPKARGLDLVLSYDSFFETNEVLKPGILLEIGFDQISPNAPRDISSWAVDSALLRSLTDVQDNRAKRVSIYNSEYTFVEKLQAIMKKHEQQKAPREWMRHYYDVYMLLGTNEVQQFIGTSDYQLHKEKRFKSLPLDLSNAAAIVLTDSAIFEKYRAAYELESSLYFGNQPKFNLIADRLRNWSAKL